MSVTITTEKEKEEDKEKKTIPGIDSLTTHVDVLQQTPKKMFDIETLSDSLYVSEKYPSLFRAFRETSPDNKRMVIEMPGIERTIRHVTKYYGNHTDSKTIEIAINNSRYFVDEICTALVKVAKFWSRDIEVINHERDVARSILLEEEANGSRKKFKAEIHQTEFLRTNEAARICCRTGEERKIVYLFADACGVAATRWMREEKRSEPVRAGRNKLTCKNHVPYDGYQYSEDDYFDDEGSMEDCKTCHWRFYVMVPVGVYLWPQNAFVGKKRTKKKYPGRHTIDHDKRRKYCEAVFL
jgi:hypothetical protein